MVNVLRSIFRKAFRVQPEAVDDAAIHKYLAGGRIPWSQGYSSFKTRFLANAVNDVRLLDLFRTGRPLPAGYGQALDERVVEFPWAVSQLGDCGSQLLDAGSTFNRPFLLEHSEIKKRQVVIFTLAPESYHLARANVSYLYGDLRHTILRDGCMDGVVCLSTLEHVGMDNTQLYTTDADFRECNLTDYRQAVAELGRVLKPGGLALITVPFGQRESHGWLQQFDRAGIEDIVHTFQGQVEDRRFYRYLPSGWVLAPAEECAACEYFNIHVRRRIDADRAAAARAVACLRLRRA